MPPRRALPLLAPLLLLALAAPRATADASFPTPPVAWSLELPGRSAFNVNNSNLNAAISSGVRFGSLVAVALVSGFTPTSAQVFAVNSSNASVAWVSQSIQVAGPGGFLALTLSDDGAVVLLTITSAVGPGTFVAFAFATGALLWSQTELVPLFLFSLSTRMNTYPYRMESLPVAHVGGFLVYGQNVSASPGAGGPLLAKLSAVTGSAVWATSARLWAAGLDATQSYIVCSCTSTITQVLSNFSAINPVSGQTLWTTVLPVPLGRDDVVIGASALSILTGFNVTAMSVVTIALADGAVSLAATTIPGIPVDSDNSAILAPFGNSGLFAACVEGVTYMIDVPMNTSAGATTLWSFVPPDGSFVIDMVVVANGSTPYVIVSTYFVYGPFNATARLWVVDASGTVVHSTPGPRGAIGVEFGTTYSVGMLNGAAYPSNISDGVVSLFIAFDTLALKGFWSIPSTRRPPGGGVSIESQFVPLAPANETGAGASIIVGATLSERATQIVAYNLSIVAPTPSSSPSPTATISSSASRSTTGSATASATATASSSATASATASMLATASATASASATSTWTMNATAAATSNASQVPSAGPANSDAVIAASPGVIAGASVSALVAVALVATLWQWARARSLAAGALPLMSKRLTPGAQPWGRTG